MTRQQTKTALLKLQKTHEITIKTTNKFSLITVVKWADYQYSDYHSNKQNRTQITDKTSLKQPIKQQTYNNKNIRNKEINNILSDNGVYNSADPCEKNYYGKLHNVLLTPSEYDEVFALDNGKTLERFSRKMYERGYKYGSHYQAILQWNLKDKAKRAGHTRAERGETRTASYDMAEFERRGNKLPVYKPAGSV